MNKLEINVVLEKAATEESITAAEPDVVILAMGVIPRIPDIPGINETNIVIAEDVLEGKAEVGGEIIVIGGEMVGCETADYLADRGKKVTLIRRGTDLADKMGIHLKTFLLKSLS